MEDQEEWNSDTPDEIATVAYSHGLAYNDQGGFFKKMPDIPDQ